MLILGLSYQEIGDFSNAQKSYKKVFTENPLHLESKLNYCNILFAINKSDEIEKCYNDILLIDSNYVRGNINIAAYYQSINKDLLAIKYYEKALFLDPLNVMAKHGLLSLNNLDNNNEKKK